MPDRAIRATHAHVRRGCLENDSTHMAAAEGMAPKLARDIGCGPPVDDVSGTPRPRCGNFYLPYPPFKRSFLARR
jgi:hypothetical protein